MIIGVTIEIKNHKGKLPCDFVHLKRVVNTYYNSPHGTLDNNNHNLLENNMDTDSEKTERFLGNSDTDLDYNIVLDNILSHRI